MRTLEQEMFDERVFTVDHQFKHNDFTTATATIDGWTPVFGAGTLVVADRLIASEEPAVLTITGTAVDDQFSALWRTLEEFKFHLGRPIRFRVDQPAGLADQNLDEQSCYIGCLEGADGANDLLDAGAGPILDADKFGFYKCGATGAAVFPANTWVCISSYGALQQTTILSAANPLNLSGEHQKQHEATIFRRPLRFEAEWQSCNAVPGVAGAAPTLQDAEVRYWINGVLCAKHQMRGAFQITTAGTEGMNFGYVTRMQAAEIAVNHLSYMKCGQLRR